jgi:hypothetical protein
LAGFGAALLVLCLSGSALGQGPSDDEWSINVFATAREPQLVYAVSYNPCRAQWANNQQGCVGWLRGVIAGNLLAPYPLGSIPLEREEIIYFVPVCDGQVDWKNAVLDRATRPIHRKEVGCRR